MGMPPHSQGGRQAAIQASVHHHHQNPAIFAGQLTQPNAAVLFAAVQKSLRKRRDNHPDDFVVPSEETITADPVADAGDVVGVVEYRLRWTPLPDGHVMGQVFIEENEIAAGIGDNADDALLALIDHLGPPEPAQ